MALFGDFTHEIWTKPKLHITSHPYYETKSFAKKHFLQKIYRVDIVNEIYPATKSRSNTKLLKAFSDDLAFCRHGLPNFTKIESDVVNNSKY